jgi:hypothetical protein
MIGQSMMNEICLAKPQMGYREMFVYFQRKKHETKYYEPCNLN